MGWCLIYSGLGQLFGYVGVVQCCWWCQIYVVEGCEQEVVGLGVVECGGVGGFVYFVFGWVYYYWQMSVVWCGLVQVFQYLLLVQGGRQQVVVVYYVGDVYFCVVQCVCQLVVE